MRGWTPSTIAECKPNSSMAVAMPPLPPRQLIRRSSTRSCPSKGQSVISSSQWTPAEYSCNNRLAARVRSQRITAYTHWTVPRPIRYWQISNSLNKSNICRGRRLPAVAALTINASISAARWLWGKCGRLCRSDLATEMEAVASNISSSTPKTQ